MHPALVLQGTVGISSHLVVDRGERYAARSFQIASFGPAPTILTVFRPSVALSLSMVLQTRSRHSRSNSPVQPHALRSTAQPLHRVLALTATTTTDPLTGFADRSATRRSPPRCRRLHRVAIDPHHERRGLVLDQVLRQIERRFQAVICRAWKPGRHLSIEVRQDQRPACSPFHHF